MYLFRFICLYVYCVFDLIVIICICVLIFKVLKCKILLVSVMVVDLLNYCKWFEEFDIFVILIIKVNGFIFFFFNKEKSCVI